MLGSFLIFFRESFEAAMICSIMLAYLKKMGRQDRFRDVWVGVAAAIVVAFAVGVILFRILRNYDGSVLQGEIESITYFVAAAILTYMTFWMQRQSRDMKRKLQEQMAGAITQGALWSIALIAFITVGREGIETVIFMIAIAFQTNPLFLAIGAALGIASGLFLSYLIYIGGRTIHLGRFFTIMGTLLMLFGAGLLANAIQDWQQLGWLPAFGHPLWNSTGLLSESSTIGDILHSFFGYSDSPSVLQSGVYILYLAIMVFLFWRGSRGTQKKRSSGNSGTHNPATPGTR